MLNPNTSGHPVRLGALVLLMAVATPTWAGPLVIRATGPSAKLFKPGQRLGDTPLALKKGDLVVVLDRKGTRSFAGPGLLDMRAPSKPAEDRIDFSDITQPDGTRAVIAATRQMVRGPKLPAGDAGSVVNPVPDERIWNVVLNHPGPHCLLAGKPVTIVRGAATTLAAVDVVRKDGQKLALGFKDGQNMLVAPARFFAASGPFVMTMAGKTAKMALTTLPPPRSDDRLEALEMVAQGLASAGCQRQFAMLADQIAPRQP